MISKKFMLTPDDLRYLVRLLMEIDSFLKAPREFLVMVGLPGQYVYGMALSSDNPQSLAQKVVVQLASYGRLDTPPYCYALEALLNYLLEQGLGREDVANLQDMLLKHKLVGVPVLSEKEALLGQPENWRNVSFLLKGARIIRTVCRIDRGDLPLGTGFLVGPDLLLTNAHVLMQGWGQTEQEQVTSLRFRFGYIEEDGLLKTGEVFSAEATGLVCSSNYSALDFALIRLTRPVGQIFGYLQPQEYCFKVAEEVSIVQHPMGWDMKFSLGQVVEDSARRVYYRAITLKGSSGSPVFDQHWNLVALHQGTDQSKSVNVGVPIRSILAEIKFYLPGYEGSL